MLGGPPVRGGDGSVGGWLTGERVLMRDGNQFLLIWCVFGGFGVTK